MKKVKKICLTCKYSDVNDDDLLICLLDDVEVKDDDVCDLYEFNKALKNDIDLGMWD